MSLTQEKILEYQRDHNFEREKFISQIKMMHQISIELKEKPRIKSDRIANLKTTSDDDLIKIHKFYWDKL